MAVPKRKTSKARRDKRRSPNMKMKAPGLSICPTVPRAQSFRTEFARTAITMTVKMLWSPRDRAGAQNLNFK